MHIDAADRRRPHGLRLFIAICALFVASADAYRSLHSCPDRHDWVKSINPRRILVLGVFYPGENDLLQNDLLPSLLPAVEMAKRDIRRDKCILTHYELNISQSDTGCKASVGTKALFSMMHDSPKKVALFGGACTTVNEPVASAAHYWNITQLSYFETHPKFTAGADSNMYKTFYRIVPAVKSEQMALLSFVKRFNWKRFGLVGQTDDERFNLPHEKLVIALDNAYRYTNLKTIAASTGFSSKKPNYNLALSKLKNESARIIIGDFNMTYAVPIFCEAYHQNLTGARHVWILSGQQSPINFSAASAAGHCKPAELESALQGHFIFEFAPYRNDTHDKAVKDVENYKEDYKLQCKQRRGCNSNNHFHAYAYDGIWALALAIDSAIKAQWENEKTFFDPDVDLIDYKKWSSRLETALNNSTFEGVTGKVKFENNERLGLIRIYQYRNRSYNFVGEFDAASEDLTIIPRDEELFFWTGDGKPPPDAVGRITQMEYIDFIVFCVMCALTSFGIILALGFLGVNVYFRSHRFIKMSSPNMNNLIIGGSLLTYVSVVLLGIDTRMANQATYDVMCTAKVGVLSVGFSLAFGSMFSKTWRVHSIFTNIKLNKKAIKDYKLFLLVFALFLVDTIILAVWIFVSPLSRQNETLSNETREDLNLVITRTREYCASTHMSIFQGLLFGYKGILLILGCFLAWETRHVNVPALNDSKYIGMSVYNVVLMCSLGVAILFILESKVNASYVLISLFIIFCTTLTLCLVFVPKIVELARNPKGAGTDRRYRQGMLKSVGTERKLSEGDQEMQKETLVRTEQDNQVWRKMLEDKKLEIAELLKRLQEHGDVAVDLSSLPKENTSQFSHSSVPDDPFGGVYLGPSGPSFAQKQQELEQQGQYLQAPTQSPCPPPKSPALDDVSETTSLLQRPTTGSFRDKLSKLRTSLSRSSMPATCSTVVDVQTSVGASDPLPSANVLRTSTSMYQSLRELHSNFNTTSAEIVTSSAPGVVGEISLGNFTHRTSTSNSSDYTDDDDDDEEEEEGSSSGGGGSFRRRRRLRYVEPISSGEGSDAAAVGTSLNNNNNNNNNNNSSTSRTLPSIKESCLSTFNEALSSCESAATDEDELLGEDSDDDDSEAKEDDALL